MSAPEENLDAQKSMTAPEAAPAKAGEGAVRSGSGSRSASGKGGSRRSASGGSGRKGGSSKSIRKPGPVEKYLHGPAERVRTLFFSDSPVAALLWFAAAFGMIAILLWFFFVSPWGTPAMPLYADF